MTSRRYGPFVLLATLILVGLKTVAQAPPGPPEPMPPPPPSSPAAMTAPDAGVPPGAPPPPTGPATSAPVDPSSGQGGIAELEGFLEPFIYDILNRRDPFMPYAEYVPVDDQAGGRALSPAQRWDLEKLKLIGIMWDVRDPKAMFLDPEDDVMILGRDESIGNKSGYIAAVREGEVVVVEAIRKRGDITYRTRVLRIER